MPISSQDRMGIERVAVRAWPALETANLAGWLWRYTGGGSQRANSVAPLDFTGADVEAGIAEAERLYGARGAAPMFQVCDVVAPADLDQRLARRGYRLQEPCTCLAKALTVAASMPRGIEVGDRAGEDWLGVYSTGVTPSRRAAAPSILSRVPAPAAFLLRRQDGVPISVALAVAHAGVVIAECVATHPEHRRKGASEQIMRALEAWGVAHGARVAALQVVAANAPAQALYAKLDYRPVGGYHYRVLDR
ncbi:MAG TPA: GNAT family N-acetyltransferase [Hyphomicrobiaceae bacterium]|nr:GNAT family N-acetyltransferase [Hyphomicrobiaceae bacterium]